MFLYETNVFKIKKHKHYINILTSNRPCKCNMSLINEKYFEKFLKLLDNNSGDNIIKYSKKIFQYQKVSEKYILHEICSFIQCSKNDVIFIDKISNKNDIILKENFTINNIINCMFLEKKEHNKIWIIKLPSIFTRICYHFIIYYMQYFENVYIYRARLTPLHSTEVYVIFTDKNSKEIEFLKPLKSGDIWYKSFVEMDENLNDFYNFNSNILNYVVKHIEYLIKYLLLNNSQHQELESIQNIYLTIFNNLYIDNFFNKCDHEHKNNLYLCKFCKRFVYT